MEDDEEIHREDLVQKLEADFPLNMEDDDLEEDANTVEVDDSEVLGKESLKVVVKTSYDVKLRELLRNIHSTESKIYSEASKEFSRLLRRDSGGEMLYQYVQASPLCSELMEAWKLRQGKPGLMYVLSLISVILDHPDGKYKSDDIERITISRRLDKFARLIIENKMEDIHTELSSKEAKRQKAALLLMAAIVRRGVGLASEVAKIFDFKLPGFPKLSEYQQKKVEKKGKQSKHSTRRSFIEFSMSFLEIGNPRLLRWVLQQKDMYSGVLRGLGSDDDDTVVYVLSTLRDRVLTPESLVPPGLRSVLFGSVTLEQLIIISGNQVGGLAADIAHKVLVMVCTDPCNGLMPDSKVGTNPLKGNLKRLLDVMKKLKATEITCHRELLLAIVTGRPLLGSAYMDEFPYSLEPRASSTWFAAISLAADLVSSAVTSHPFSSLSSQSQDSPSLDSLEVQCMLKCVVPRAFSRMVINRGLLHSDAVVKHGSLRLLLEALKSLARLLADCASSNRTLQSWVSLKQEIQDEARAVLPDPQVLLKLLSSLSSSHSTASKTRLKRARQSEDLPDVYHMNKVKKLKSDMVVGDFDILISGISTDSETALLGETGKITGSFTVEELDDEMDPTKVIFGIWGLNGCSILGDELNDVDVYFHSKLLDALTLYLRTMPIAMERSFDFFKLLPGDPLGLPIILQQSLLHLLVEHIGGSPVNEVSTRMPELMYRHLQPFINLLMFAPVRGIKDQACVLAREAMLSTGAFDRSISEIDAWFLFLPGYTRNTSWGTQEVEVFRDLSAVVVPFLCDAVSTIGNNLYKYLDLMRSLISNLKGFEDISPDFSPLVICVLQKCLRLLDADSKTFKLSEKTMISTYVCNTLSFLLQTQVEGGLLSAVIEFVLTERFEGSVSIDGDSRKFPCEWRPLRNLFLFAQSISRKEACNKMCSVGQKTMDTGGGSLVKTLGEVKKIIKSASGEGLVEVAIAFSASIICATCDEILEYFPSVLTVSQHLLGAPLPFLLTKVFLEPYFIVDVAKRWPHMLFSGLEMVGATRTGGSNNITQFSSAGELLCSLDFDSMESISVAFSFFLKQASFYALFPAIVTIGSSDLSDPTKELDLLLAKLSEGSLDDSIASLRLVLFWVHQIQSSLRTESSGKLEQLLETCFILIKNVLQQLLVVKPYIDSSTASSRSIFAPYIPEVVEIIFHHPVVVTSLSRPLCYTEELASEIFGDSLGDFLSFSKQRIHPLDHHILNILTTVCEYLSSCNGQNFVPEVHDTSKKWVVKAFEVLFLRLYLGFKEKFDLCVSAKNLMHLVPTFYIFHALSRFISPFQLFELVEWIFSKVDWDDPTVGEFFKVSALSVGIYIAACAFDMLSSCLYQPNTKVITSHWFWDVEGRNFDVALLEKIYYRVAEFATSIRLDCADLCLLKAVNAVYRQKHMQPQSSMLPLTMELSRVVTSSPLALLSHCIHRTNKTRAKLLFLLTEVCPLHLSHFGQIFFCIMSKDLSVAGCPTEMCCNTALSDEEFLLFLPTVFSYLNSSLVKFGKHHIKQFESITSFYSRILLAGFLNWKSYVSQHIFIEGYDDLLPSSSEELLNLVNGSLLGKAILMLQYYFSFNRDSIRIDSSYLHSGPHDDLLECDTSEINICSLNQLLNLINRIVAKISFSRILLFPEDNVIQSLPTKADGDLKESPLGRGSKKEDRQRLRFLNVLVNTWHRIVRIINNSETSKGTEGLQLIKFLEAFVLRSIFQFTERMQSNLIQMHSLPFLEKFTRLCLLHRLEDPATMNVLCGVLTLLSGGKLPCAVAFELLLAHSQFVPTILWSDLSSDSSGLSSSGTLLRPISSILKSFFFPSKSGADGKSGVDTSASYQKKLAVIKLLRVLYHLKGHQDSLDSGKDFGMKSRELLSLLLSCYRATLSEVDLEIFNLMIEIESIEGSDCGSIVEMDFLWGSSALKIRSEQSLEKILSTNNVIDCETVKDRRRRQFRENLPIDPKLSVKTILYFPFDRIACSGPSDMEKFRQDNLMDTLEMPSTSAERILRYDPVFILRFSIHALSMGYIEPMEFAALGLLGIAFVSVSSPDEGMRKMGYEVLGSFKNALENYKNRKEGLQLNLLVTCLKNGIEEPFQKIPSLIGIFAAEASFILLDPSHEHYFTISKFLMRSPRVNLKAVPLFDTFFGSSSVNFKGDRLWLLRLSYAGLNLDDDAQIFKRKCIIENLMGFYASSMSDYESRILILQIVKKSIKSQVIARYLVEYCGLISWLSSVISFGIETLHGDLENHLVTQLTMVLEVTVGVISFRNVTEWLQKYGLEQLSELSFDLQKLLAVGIKLIKQNVVLVNSILQILESTFRISQKRKMYQPHITLSFEGLFQLFLAIDDGFNNMESGLTTELGLRAILMSTPPIFIFQKDREKFSKLVIWAICATLQSTSMQTSLLNGSEPNITIFSEKEQCEDSLISKLLRWITASVILGRVSTNSYLAKTISSQISNIETLQSLLDHIKKGNGESRASSYDNDKALAAMILYLQQLLGSKCSVLPSVISALCLLLLSDASTSTETELLVIDHHSLLASLCSQIRCPTEAKPSWRWSFYQPWKDLSSELTDLQKLQEHHACQALLVIFSNALGVRPLDLPILSYEDVDNSGLFQWERSMLNTE
ncbi:uncharacterized protein LOC122059441 isoform X2 [Macadamia integrifolia]|uniref:uncharacterized protein LOC122059441 isoform X2 n=1 Tax=Macadamia integrifolia TaxID=60698 RepID=UPI001C527BDD|nr:uncharacterized protein LOC122059441 isoform X2 [Macadamia integrifolia]